MNLGKIVSVLGKIGKVATWLGELLGGQKLPPPPPLPRFDENHDGNTEPVPLTWRDVAKRRDDEAKSIAASKAAAKPSSRYE